MEETQRKELNKSVKLLRGKLNEQTEKTVKVEQELARVKNSLQTQTDKRNKQASETQHLKSELSKCNQKYLLLEEEETKLKESTIERASKEKSDVLSQLYKLQITYDAMDNKLQHVTDN